jgi:putative membrane protein
MIPLAQMMDDWGDHDGSRWGWIVMMVLMVVLVAVVVVVVVRLMTQTPAAAPPPGGASRSAEDLLADRLARGEIDVDEYRRRLDALRSG